MRVLRPEQHEPPRIKPKLLQARRVDVTKLAVKKSLPDQQHRPPLRRPVRKSEHGAKGRWSIAEARRAKLMQGSSFQATAQRCVDRLGTK
jgi:hypothetical protein